MKSLHWAVIIGDTTGGGAHPVGPAPVVMGFVADIPFARSLNPYTHTDWEGTGVYPDISVSAAIALEKARKTIFTDQAQHATIALHPRAPRKCKKSWSKTETALHQLREAKARQAE